MVDGIVVGLILLSAIFGLIRGVVSQVMALAGLAAAYFLAPLGGEKLGMVVQGELGSSRFMAEKASIFLVGLGLYLAVRLAGYGIEKSVVNRVRELWKLNRIGGGVLGALKTTVLIAIVFFFLAVVPHQFVRAWTPKLTESHTYQLAARYNPMGDQVTLESMRKFRTTVMDPSRNRKLRDHPEMREILSRHELTSALGDQQFVRAVEEGDYDQLRKNERVEELMHDEQLTALLAQLD